MICYLYHLYYYSSNIKQKLGKTRYNNVKLTIILAFLETKYVEIKELTLSESFSYLLK